MDSFEGQLQRSNNIVMRKIAGETMLIPIHQTGVDLQKVYLLNETATAVWLLLEQPQSLESLVEALQQEFEADSAVIKEDLLTLLNDLAEQDFIHRVEGRL
jgi:hypothetical protein